MTIEGWRTHLLGLARKSLGRRMYTFFDVAGTFVAPEIEARARAALRL